MTIIKFQLNLISFIIILIISPIISQSLGIKAQYPHSLLLHNGKLFIANIEGIFICNINLDQTYETYSYYNKTVNSENIGVISKKTLIVQFPEENGNIICIVKDTLYFFDSEGNYLFMYFIQDIELDEYNDSLYNLLTYKKEGDYSHFIITYILNSRIYILQYKASTTENILIYKGNFRPFYFDFPAIKIQQNGLGCQIMNSQEKGKVLTCCFQTKNENFIIVQSLQIENNYEPLKEDLYSKVGCQQTYVIVSVVSEDEKNLLTCYHDKSNHGFCFVFNIDTNEIKRNVPIIKEVTSAYNKMKLFYFKETKEVIFASSNNQNHFTIIKMKDDSNFTIINRDSYSTPNFDSDFSTSYFNCFDIIYDPNEKKYALISDVKSAKDNLASDTDKYLININFDNDFNGGSQPSAYQEASPPTSSYPLEYDNKYFLEVIQQYRIPITVNEKSGIIIDFLNENNPVIRTKENKTINASYYAINFENMPEGELMYIINGESIKVEKNERKFGEFKIKYIPPEGFGRTDQFTFKVYLRNYSIASNQVTYYITICKENCSCFEDQSSCYACAKGYSYYKNGQQCYSDSDLVSTYKDSNGISQDCYDKCKTCSEAGVNENYMHCTSCFFENNYILVGSICKTNPCGKRHYIDETKIYCWNYDYCPDHHPVYIEAIKECIEYDGIYTELTKESHINDGTFEIENYFSSKIETTFIDKTEKILQSSGILSNIISDKSQESLTPVITDKINETKTNSFINKESIIKSDDETYIASISMKPTQIEQTEKEIIIKSDEQIYIENISMKPTQIEQTEKESIIKSDDETYIASISMKPTQIELTEKESIIKSDKQTYIENISLKPTEIEQTDEYYSPSTAIISEQEGYETNKRTEETIEDKSTSTNIFDFEREIIEIILDIIFNNKNSTKIEEYLKQLKDANKTYSVLSDMITNKKINISSGDEDIILKTDNYTFEITTTENQKNKNSNSETSIIDLGECEKIIKRNISNETDPTPLIILKIDIKKDEYKSTGVEYEVYNPYTKKKINLDICSNTQISIIAPINLTSDEYNLYDSLKEQGYDLFDANDSFYQDICTPYTSLNGTDIIIIDRKIYYYNEDIVLCEKECNYDKVNSQNKKVVCQCSVKNGVDLNSNNFDMDKFMEGFYKVEDYTNYQVLYCYNLVFSSRVKKNICFYILLVLLVLFLSSMIVNLKFALKKIDEIIFKIFQDKFMFAFMQKIIMNGRKRRNELKAQTNKPSNQNGEIKKLSWLEKLKLRSRKRQKTDNNNDNNINNGDKDNNNNNDINAINIFNLNTIKKKKKKMNKKKSLRMSYKQNNSNKMNNVIGRIDKSENKINLSVVKHDKINVKNNDSVDINDLDNEHYNLSKTLRKKKKLKKKKSLRKSCSAFYKQNQNNINISIINNVIKPNSNPPKKKINKCVSLSQSKEVETMDKINIFKSPIKKSKRKKSKSKSFGKSNYSPFTSISVSPSPRKNKKDESSKNELLKKQGSTISEKFIKDKKKKLFENKNKEEKKVNRNIKYIDEELNRMDYEDALIYDNRNYWQYYLSLLKKKHMILLTFASINDYNVFLLKFSLFVLSLALFFSLNTLFFRDSTMRQIFADKGKYNFLYQIPQVLYSTIISSLMTFILKKLSLSQNELIAIKREPNKKKANKLADSSKRWMKIKFYLFFFIGLFLLIFCWYYLTAFACVYPNTQIHLLKDTLISFGISMSYPFLINLIPGLFRIPALRAEKRDKEKMYKASKIIALL